MKGIINSIILVVIALSIAAMLTCCGKGIDTLPCERYGYGIVDLYNFSDDTKYGAFCRIDEGRECIAEYLTIRPRIKNSVRLRLPPGTYQFLLEVVDEFGQKQRPAWEVEVRLCRNVKFEIEKHKVSLGDQPYHHLADKAKPTERTSDVSKGME